MSLELTFAPLSDVGRERAENQDAFGSEHQDALDFYIVCDGMGGHRGGSTASRLAVETIVTYLGEQTEQPPAQRMIGALVEANRVILERAEEDPQYHGMGTTAVVLAVDHDDGAVHYAHVGDSRIYLIRGDTVRQLTRDHTFVQRLVDDGILDAEAAVNHPQGNVIIRSLGGQDEVDVELGDTPLQAEEGDIYLLCSDGLHGLVESAELAALAIADDLERAATNLVALANERGGNDNITVELVRVGRREEPEPDEWMVLRPTPAPGTRLARLAARGTDIDPEATRTTAPMRAPLDEADAGPGPAGDTPVTLPVLTATNTADDAPPANDGETDDAPAENAPAAGVTAAIADTIPMPAPDVAPGPSAVADADSAEADSVDEDSADEDSADEDSADEDSADEDSAEADSAGDGAAPQPGPDPDEPTAGDPDADAGDRTEAPTEAARTVQNGAQLGPIVVVGVVAVIVVVAVLLFSMVRADAPAPADPDRPQSGLDLPSGRGGE